MSLSEADRFVVVTGGPGSGKTTLIERLAGMGFGCSEEAGRGVIRDQLAVGGCGLPWADVELFAELMLSWELRSYRLASGEHGLMFFDRGVPDVIGYLRLEDRRVPEHVRLAARRFAYRSQVFVAPPWPEIYRTDEQRTQSVGEAERTYESMVRTYTEYGYELRVLPKAPVDERVRFVFEHLGVLGAPAGP